MKAIVPKNANDSNLLSFERMVVGNGMSVMPTLTIVYTTVK
jgi:hypothetical protein